MATRRIGTFFATIWSVFALSSVRSAPPYTPLSHAVAEDPEPAFSFDPDVVRAAVGSARGAALTARAAGRLDVARAAALDGIVHEPEEAPLLRFLAALAAQQLGDSAEAAELLLTVVESGHALSAWARLNMAQALEVSDPAQGLALLEPLCGGSSDSEGFPGADDARRLRGRLLARVGRADEAIEQLEAVLDARPDESAAVQVVMPLGELFAAREDEGSHLRALALYRRVAHRVPGTRVGERAQRAAAQVLAGLSARVRASVRVPSADDRLALADALLLDAQFGAAERAYRALGGTPAEQAARLCKVQFARAKALLDRRDRAQGGSAMADVAARCETDADLRAWARYHAARAFSAVALNTRAVEQYDALQREAPGHRLADDALYRSSKVMLAMGLAAEARARLAALPARFPAGDMRPRARFALAWQSYTEGDLNGAATLLEGSERELEDAEDLHGRAPYWHARFLSKLGRVTEAADAFAALFARTPLSYYGQQAFARLDAHDPVRAQTLREGLSVAQNTPLLFVATPALRRPGFLRAVALLQVGEASLAMSELRALGFLQPDADPELHWAAVALFDRAGFHTLSVELARHRVLDLLQRAPRGRDLALYRLAYPPAFAPLIEEASHRENVPSAFVRAVAREESAFNPGAVSRAQAYGLIQIIRPTARAIARGLDLPHDVQALCRPEINLALGVRFIGTLASELGGQFALVPAAYNAGPGAAQRWLTERADQAFDVWIENVPYDETRHYTRRVLQSYGIYAWLDSAELLSLPATL